MHGARLPEESRSGTLHVRLHPAADFEPAYLALQRSGELARRASAALAGLRACETCPRRCAVNRLEGETGTCETARLACVASVGSHHGEEACLSGWAGSGAIFFSQCGLHCVFCQNFDVSHEACGRPLSAEALAATMLELQDLGCHNINLVTPSHVVPQILEALVLAAARGLRLPLVYNSSGYDALPTLRLLNGVVDVYMPDFKFWDPAMADRYLGAPDYPTVARAALREMHRQVGPLSLDERGLARRGVLVRHLVMPGGVAGTPRIMAFLAHRLSPDTYVNVMNQYHPAGLVKGGAYAEIGRPLTRTEHDDALEAAHEAGLARLDERRPPGLWR